MSKCDSDVTQLLKLVQHTPEAKSNGIQWKTSRKILEWRIIISMPLNRGIVWNKATSFLAVSWITRTHTHVGLQICAVTNIDERGWALNSEWGQIDSAGLQKCDSPAFGFKVFAPPLSITSEMKMKAVMSPINGNNNLAPSTATGAMTTSCHEGGREWLPNRQEHYKCTL